MKNTVLNAKKSVALALCFLMIFSFSGCGKEKETGADGQNSQTKDTGVQIVDILSDEEESSYTVSATLPDTSFSFVSSELSEMLAAEWKTYDSMTYDEKMVSSHSFGIISFHKGTWADFEETIGLSVENPLEALSWLNKSGILETEGFSPYDAHLQVREVLHVDVTANADNPERKLREISASAMYGFEGARITLTTTLSESGGTYSIGHVYLGYVDFEEKAEATGSGIPVKIVFSDVTENSDYYGSRYYDAEAYWVKDNVFYSLQVIGESAEQAEIREIMNRILAEI